MRYFQLNINIPDTTDERFLEILKHLRDERSKLQTAQKMEALTWFDDMICKAIRARAEFQHGGVLRQPGLKEIK